ncbi:MAG: hypothetical protein K0S14_374 [Thermomicrobiales bacterium]|nr:hypothetical protein [Thermomicrobiales bacterium]
MAGDEGASGAGDALQTAGVDVHQCQCCVVQLGVAENVADESQWKDVPSRPNDRDLCQLPLAFDAHACRRTHLRLDCLTTSTRQETQLRPLCDISKY